VHEPPTTGASTATEAEPPAQSGSVWRRLGALYGVEFRRLFWARTVSVFGDSLVPVALSFAVLDLTGSASDLGIVLAAEAFALFAFMLVGGVWSDRLPRRAVLIATDLVRFTIQAAVAALLITGTAQIWQLIVLMTLYGVAAAFFYPASTGLVPETVTGRSLQQANATLGLSASVAALVGPATAGFLVAASSAGYAFAVDAATFGVSALFLWPLNAGRAPASEAAHFGEDFVEGWREFRARRWLQVKVVHWTLFLLLAYAPVGVLGPLVAKRALGGAAAWGVIETSFALGGIAGRSASLRIRPRRPVVACFAMTLLSAPVFALLAVPAALPLIVVARGLMGAALAFYGSVWSTTLQEHIQPGKLSRVSSYDWMGSLTFLPLGFAVAGPFADKAGVSAVLWVACGWTIASTFAALAVPSVRKLHRAEPPVAAGVHE
jgi:MFS family permease